MCNYLDEDDEEDTGYVVPIPEAHLRDEADNMEMDHDMQADDMDSDDYDDEEEEAPHPMMA
jgi:hypothetical protein